MEYRIETTGYLSDEDVLKAVKALLNPTSGLSPNFYAHGAPIDIPLPGRNAGFGGAPADARSTIGANGLPRPGMRKPGPELRPPNRFVQARTAGSARTPTVRFVPISNWGGTDRYYFWKGTSRLLQTGSRGIHPQWSNMVANWHSPISVASVSFQPVPTLTVTPNGAGKSVARMTSTEKLSEAMLRALPRIPHHLKQAVEDLLTPVNIALFVGITVVLMSSGVGEVLGVGLLVFGFVAGGLDLCLHVLGMVFDFYKKATRATTEHELDQAAELFVQIVLRGGMDILDILVGRRAAAKLAGRGLRSVGAYLGYLEEEMKLWRARQAGPGRVRPGAAAAEEEAQAARTRQPAPPVLARLPKYRTRPPFKKNPNHSQAEFDRQIQGQQEGLNKMTVEEYLENSDKYNAQGRAPEGTKAQQAARELARKDKVKELIKQGKTPTEAKIEAEKWMDTQNALHNPDQIAGGHADQIEGMGDAGVNKSIGSQWEKQGRAKNMDDYIRDKAKNMTPQERKTTKLDIELDH